MERAELSRVLRTWLSGELGARSAEPKLISETDPARFMAAFAEATASEADVFLCDPHWGTTGKERVTTLLQSSGQDPRSHTSLGWLMIPTGGSGGRLQFARHDQDTIAAAVRGFTQHFSLKQVNAMGVLPLHHVSGFMPWMRCVLTGGEYRHLDWKAVEQGDLPDLPAKPDGWVLSVVPTQLERLLRQPLATEWLAEFRIVFLGGAAAGGGLLDRAAAALIPLAPGYGLTETVAMVTALRPEEFLAGARSSGRALPHAQVDLTSDGTISVRGRSVFRGYYPKWLTTETLVTNDTGSFDERGHLVVLGRKDGVIISGGEKIQPAEVEAVLRDRGGLTEVVVMGLADAEWGQIVVAAYPAVRQPDQAKLQQVINSHLLAPQRPKRLIAMESWPLTGPGKVNRAEVARLVRSSQEANTKPRSS